jgi:hypothetical protein
MVALSAGLSSGHNFNASSFPSSRSHSSYLHSDSEKSEAFICPSFIFFAHSIHKLDFILCLRHQIYWLVHVRRLHLFTFIFHSRSPTQITKHGLQMLASNPSLATNAICLSMKAIWKHAEQICLFSHSCDFNNDFLVIHKCTLWGLLSLSVYFSSQIIRDRGKTNKI